jgi:hypothetical protein
VVPLLFKPIPPPQPSEVTNTHWLDERLNQYFVDADIIPLFVQENYLHARPYLAAEANTPANEELRRRVGPSRANEVTEIAALDIVAAAADNISVGDMLNTQMMTEQDYTLSQAHAFMSTVLPAYLMRGGLSDRLAFPAALGKLSTRNKNLRVAREFKIALSTAIHASAEDQAMFILPQLRKQMLESLIGAPDDVSCRADNFGVTLQPDHAHTALVVLAPSHTRLLLLSCIVFVCCPGWRGIRDRVPARVRFGQGGFRLADGMARTIHPQRRGKIPTTRAHGHQNKNHKSVSEEKTEKESLSNRNSMPR